MAETIRERLHNAIEHLEAMKTTRARLQDDADQLKEQIDRMEIEVIPSILEELGMESAVMADGTTVGIKEKIVASPSDKRRALEWLIKNGHGEIVDKRVVVHADDEAELNRIVAEFGETALDFRVHPARLNSFAAELMASGEQLPDDLFNIVPVRRATIKREQK